MAINNSLFIIFLYLSVHVDSLLTFDILCYMEIKNIGLIKKLIKSELTEKEALVYLSVLELGGAFPSRIAKYAGLRRATTYNILTTLSVRGFVNEIKNKNKIYYQIDKPESILKYTKSKLHKAEESIEQINEILPDIKNIFSSILNQPKITYYSGEKGIFDIFDDMVNNQKPYEMLVFVNGKEFINVLNNDNRDYYQNFMKTKETKNITTRTIIPDTKEDRKAGDIFYEGINKKFWPNFRYTEKNTFPSASEVTIYGTNKVSIINFKKDYETGVIIEDQAIHDMMKAIFELSWDSRQLKIK
jgi:HTH-type transcriptional regulator, sugar sensing transcriptional regulator